MVPLPRTCLIPGILVILPPSAASQSTVGAGFPLTVQSTRPPFTFVNSTRDGGSDTKLGPCISYEASQPVTKHPLHAPRSLPKSNATNSSPSFFSLQTQHALPRLYDGTGILILRTRLVIRSAIVPLAVFLKGLETRGNNGGLLYSRNIIVTC